MQVLRLTINARALQRPAPSTNGVFFFLFFFSSLSLVRVFLEFRSKKPPKINKNRQAVGTCSISERFASRQPDRPKERITTAPENTDPPPSPGRAVVLRRRVLGVLLLWVLAVANLVSHAVVPLLHLRMLKAVNGITGVFQFVFSPSATSCSGTSGGGGSRGERFG